MNMTRRRTAAIAAALLGTLSIGELAAQQAPETSFQVEHFEPLPSQGANLLNLGKSDVLPHLSPSFGVFSHYADSQIRFVRPTADGDEELINEPLARSLKAELWASFGLFNFFELGVVVPLVAYQSGDDLTAFGRDGDSIEGFALQDVRLVPELRLPIDRDDLAGFGASVIVPVYLPVGDSDAFGSDDEVRYEPRLVLDWAHSSGFAITTNLGYQFRSESTARNVVIGNDLRYGVGAEVPLGTRRVKAIASFFGTITNADDADAPDGFDEIDDFFSNKANPMELLGGLQFELPAHIVASVGGGAGLNDSVGSPAWRAFASIGYTPMVQDRDNDGIPDDEDECPTRPEDVDGFEDFDGCPDPDNDLDTILDVDDQCPLEAEDVDTFEDEDGCPDPDNDKDGVLDVNDQCPLVAGLPENQGCPDTDKDDDGLDDDVDKCPDDPEDVDGFEDTDGCPDPDNDADSILDVNDKCPLEAEDKDGFEDEDGCPDPDNDKDGILDVNDECPTEAETYNGNKDEDGCPDGKQTVVITETEIRILEKVFFDTAKAKIKRRSYPLLNTVATVLKQNPQITAIRVEGHTDDRGSDSYNLDLSQRRAASVREYLEGRGIGADRLVSQGFGETRPLCEDIPELLANERKNRRKIKECRAANRRVQFKILELNGKPIEADDSVTIEQKEVIEEAPTP